MELSHAAGHAATRRWCRSVIRFLASLKLAVILMVCLAAVLSVATVVEANHGMAYVHWYVYKSAWFSILLVLLAVNIFFAAAVRFPWRRHQTGFVVTHAGLLVLLAGAIMSFMGGIEGQVSLVEGQAVGHLTLPERSQITAVWEGRLEEPPYEFAFDGGPVDWHPDRVVDLGEVDGVSARVLRFYRHATPVNEWVEVAEGGVPFVRFRVNGRDGKPVAEHYLADERFGEALLLGPIRVQLQRVANGGMLADFLDNNPPAAEGDGLLTACYQDTVERVRVSGNVGKRIAIGATGASLEIADYLPNARPDQMGRFASKGNEAGNPMVELRVHLPNETQPIRQIAFAKDPLLNLDGVYARECPVKFRYTHPAVKPAPSVELMQASDGKLYYRVLSDGRPTSHGVVLAGDKFPISNDFEFAVTQYLPHAENRLSFAAAAPDNKTQPEPAALLEFACGGESQQVWMQRSHANYGTRRIVMPGGRLLLQYGCGNVPFDITLKLEKFRRDLNPGREGDAAFASTVRLIDEGHDVDESTEISVNRPLTHRRYTFYQSGFNQGGHGQDASVLTVAYDPGRPLKYAGSLMICTGIAMMFFMRAYFFTRTLSGHQPGAGDNERWNSRPAANPAAAPALFSPAIPSRLSPIKTAGEPRRAA
jgi:hypothetical protein